MKKLSLLKAMMSEDMQMFRYKAKANTSRLKQFLFPLFLVFVVMYSVGVYAYLLAEPLSKVHLTYVMLSLFLFFVTIISFMEGLYKSQGILFESKDNDFLLSLPITKKVILLLRILKLLIFQFLYNLLFLLPVFIVYVYFERPGFLFYGISFVNLFLLPIIPTVASGIIGYFIKLVSTRFKAKRFVQTILTIIVMLGIFFLSFDIENLVNNIVKNATSINDMVMNLYYPIGAYITLIDKFDGVIFLRVIFFHLIPLVLFVYLGSIYYFRVISRSSSCGIVREGFFEKKIKERSKLISLVKKELVRFFSSPVYILNTTFGVFIMVAVTIFLCMKGSIVLSSMDLSEFGIIGGDINSYLPGMYCALIVFVGCMSFMTSSSISLEGKCFNIMKGLPVSVEKIFLAKILVSSIISLPLMVISDLIFMVKFRVSGVFMVLILLLTLVVPTFMAVIGLIINLKYPKLEFSNDTEVVKQSVSVMISTFLGMGIFAVTTYLMMKFVWHLELFLFVEFVLFLIGTILSWFYLCRYGTRDWNRINI